MRGIGETSNHHEYGELDYHDHVTFNSFNVFTCSRFDRT